MTTNKQNIESLKNKINYINSYGFKNVEKIYDQKTVKALATNLKEQDSKTQLVKSFDSLMQILFERDGITSLNSISIADGSKYTNGVISRNIGLDLTTTQDSLLSLLEK